MKQVKYIIPKPAKNAQFDSKKSSLLSRPTSEKFHLYLRSAKAESTIIQLRETTKTKQQLQIHYILKTVIGIQPS